jgi:hypothetical protein
MDVGEERWRWGQEIRRMYCTHMHTSKQTGGEFHMGLVIVRFEAEQRAMNDLPNEFRMFRLWMS